MFKLVVVSLVAGALILLGGWGLLYGLQRPDLPPVELSPDTVWAGVGKPSIEGGQVELTLDPAGNGVLVWPVPELVGEHYPLLELQFQRPPDSLGVFWKTTELGQQMAQHWTSGRVNTTVWLQMGELAYWSDNLVELALVMRGTPGAEVGVQSVVLHPASPLAELRALYFDWMAYTPWSLTSINNYPGGRSVGAHLYPLPLVATLLVCGVLFFALLRRATHYGRAFAWRVPAALFLTGWLALDLVWQGKLWQQVYATAGLFAGKDSATRLRVGPEAALVEFASGVRERITAQDARVFIASADEYSGMRLNYYLYPLNVYWQRSGGELPARAYLRGGDYIVSIKPSGLTFDLEKQQLQVPDGTRIPAKLLASSGLGSLFRVM